MRNRWRRRSEAAGTAGSARPEAEVGATGGGGVLGWFRKHIVGSIIGTAVVASLTVWLGGFLDAALRDVAPSGADAFCSFREAVTDYWPFAEPTQPSERFTILIATIDGDDGGRTYTWAVSRAFLNQDGIDRVNTCHVSRLESSSRRATTEAVSAAQGWLKQHRADLLIGGRLLKKDEAVDLWFIGTGGGQGFQPTQFRLDANLLKEDFKQAASTQLLGVALAAVNPATEQQGKYLVEILRPVTSRLRRLLQDSAGFSEEQRAQLYNALGLGLWAVGEQSGQSQDLVDAAAAYRAALSERTRDRVPLQWAMTQNNLGNALTSLGGRESGTARLEKAVAAYRAALEEWTRERAPLDWAMTQNNLGNALWRLGERESGTARMEEAVVAYRAALTEWTRERVPLGWAGTQSNLGNALTTLGERESGTARLEEAVVALRAALKEQTRKRVPFHWAMTQNNLGNALTNSRRARGWHGAADGGARCLSRGAGGAGARARAARLGDDAEQSRHRAVEAR